MNFSVCLANCIMMTALVPAIRITGPPVTVVISPDVMDPFPMLVRCLLDNFSDETNFFSTPSLPYQLNSSVFINTIHTSSNPLCAYAYL